MLEDFVNRDFDNHALSIVYGQYTKNIVAAQKLLLEKPNKQTPDYTAAIKLCGAALALCDFLPTAFLLRGEIHQKAGNNKKAFKDYETVIRIAPNHTVALLKRLLLSKQILNKEKGTLTEEQLAERTTQCDSYNEAYLAASKLEKNSRIIYENCLNDNCKINNKIIKIDSNAHFHAFLGDQAKERSPKAAVYYYSQALSYCLNDSYTVNALITLFIEQQQYKSAHETLVTFVNDYNYPLAYLNQGLIFLHENNKAAARTSFIECLKLVHPAQFATLNIPKYRQAILSIYNDPELNTNALGNDEINELTAAVQAEPENYLFYLNRATVRENQENNHELAVIDMSFAVWLAFKDNLDFELYLERSIVHLEMNNLMMATRDMAIINKYASAEIATDYNQQLVSNAFEILLGSVAEDNISQCCLDILLEYAKDYRFLQKCAEKLLKKNVCAEAELLLDQAKILIEGRPDFAELIKELNELSAKIDIKIALLERYDDFQAYRESQGRMVEFDYGKIDFDSMYAGYILYHEKEYEAAIDIFNVVLASEQMDYMALIYRGFSYYSLNRPEEARKDLEECLQETNDRDVWLTLGGVYKSSNRKEDAIYHIRQGLIRGCHNLNVSLKIIGYLLDIDFSKAKAPKNEVLVKLRKARDLYVAESEQKNNKVPKKKVAPSFITQLNTAIELSPDVAELHAMRGDFYFKDKLWEEAVLNYSIAVSLNNTHKIAGKSSMQALVMPDDSSDEHEIFSIKRFLASMEHDPLVALQQLPLPASINKEDLRYISKRCCELSLQAETEKKYVKARIFLVLVEKTQKAISPEFTAKVVELEAKCKQERNSQSVVKTLAQNDADQEDEAIDFPQQFAAYRSYIKKQKYDEAIKLQPSFPDAYIELAKIEESNARLPENKQQETKLLNQTILFYEMAIKASPGNHTLMTKCADLAYELKEESVEVLYRELATRMVEEERDFLAKFMKGHEDYPDEDINNSDSFVSLAAGKANFRAKKIDKTERDLALYHHENTAMHFKNDVLSRMRIAEILLTEETERDQLLDIDQKVCVTEKITLYYLALGYQNYLQSKNKYSESRASKYKYEAGRIFRNCVRFSTPEDYVIMRLFFKDAIFKVLNNLDSIPNTINESQVVALEQFKTQAEQHVKEKNYGAAIQDYHAALQLRPDSIDLYQNLADCYALKNDQEQASLFYAAALWLASMQTIKNSNQLIKIHNKRALNYFRLGKSAQAHFEINSVKVYVEHLQWDASKLESYYFNQGHQNLKTKTVGHLNVDFLLLRYLTSDNNFYYDCFMTLCEDNLIAESLSFLLMAIAFLKNKLMYNHDLLDTYWGKLEDFLKLIIAIDTEFNPSSVSSVHTPDEIQKFINEFTLVQQVYSSTMTQLNVEERVKHCIVAGHEAFSRLKFQLAIYYFNAVLSVNPDNYAICFDRGMGYYSLMNMEKAFADFDVIVKANESRQALFMRGLVNFHLTKKIEARKDLRMAVATLSRNEIIQIKLCEIPSEILTFLNEVPQTNKTSTTLNKILSEARSNIAKQKYASAMALLHQLLNSYPLNHAAYALLADINYKSENKAAALINICTAYGLAPEVQSAQYLAQKEKMFAGLDYVSYLETEEKYEVKNVVTATKNGKVFKNSTQATKRKLPISYKVEKSDDEEDCELTKPEIETKTEAETKAEIQTPTRAETEIKAEVETKAESKVETKTPELDLPKPLAISMQTLEVITPSPQPQPSLNVSTNPHILFPLTPQQVNEKAVPNKIELTPLVISIFDAIAEIKETATTYLTQDQVIDTVMRQYQKNLHYMPGTTPEDFKLLLNCQAPYVGTIDKINSNHICFITDLPVAQIDLMLKKLFPTAANQPRYHPATRSVLLSSEGIVITITHSVDPAKEPDNFALPRATRDGLLLNLNKPAIVARRLICMTSEAELFKRQPWAMLEVVHHRTARTFILKDESEMHNGASYFPAMVKGLSRLQSEINFYLNLLFSRDYSGVNHNRMVEFNLRTVLNPYIEAWKAPPEEVAEKRAIFQLRRR